MVVITDDDMPIDELSKKAFKCLVDNFGYFNAMNYVLNLMEEGRKTPPNYSETQMKIFDNMSDEEFLADLDDYIKNHPHE